MSSFVFAPACPPPGVTSRGVGSMSMSFASSSTRLLVVDWPGGVRRIGARGRLPRPRGVVVDAILLGGVGGSRSDCGRTQATRTPRASGPSPRLVIASGPPSWATSHCGSILSPKAGTSAVAVRPLPPAPPLCLTCALFPRPPPPATAPVSHRGPDLHSWAPLPCSPGASSLSPGVLREGPRERQRRVLELVGAWSQLWRHAPATPGHVPATSWRLSHLTLWRVGGTPKPRPSGVPQ